MTNSTPHDRPGLERVGLDRRALLRGAAGFAALSAPLAALSRAGDANEGRKLVVLQLSGGNDGLATIVPHGDDLYQRARQTTSFSSKEVLRIDDYRGFHPALGSLRRLYDAGQLAIVEGVGYPDGIRSHFKSLEVWHTGRRSGRVSGDGWLARLGAELDPNASSLAVHVGGSAPYSLVSAERPPIAFESPSAYRWFGEAAARDAYADAGLEAMREAGERGSAGGERGAGGGDREGEDGSDGARGRDAVLRRLRGALDGARHSSARIREASLNYRSHASYPESALGAKLYDIAALIHSDLGARILSVELGGFDTHAEQRPRHDELMRELDEALGAFLADLKFTAAGRETLVLVYSEFGRRLAENGSKGTDHGKAAPLFVLGHAVRGGLHGQRPSLHELVEGDPEFTTDFRSVFQGISEDWFGVDGEKVLGARYPRSSLLS